MLDLMAFRSQYLHSVLMVSVAAISSSLDLS